MSDDGVYINCLRNGESHKFERALAEEILYSDTVEDEYVKHFDIRYADGGTNIVMEDSETIERIVFYHCGGPTFFDKVWKIADVTGSMISWIGYGIPRAVTRLDMLQHLPKEMEQDEPEPFVVRDGKELFDVICSTS